jgi:heme a synthase
MSVAPSSQRLQRSVLVALVANIVIVISGGTVRVTGSGLGCPTWPRCDPDSWVPLPGGEHSGLQTAIEFGNRLLSLVVLLAVIAVFVEVRRTRPHRRPVELLAWVLVAGVAGQVVVGGITVLTQLTPQIVALHFLLSMLLIAAAVTLYHQVRPVAPEQPPGRGVRGLTNVLVPLAFVVLVLGTVVTGAGPHGGDAAAPRYALDIRTVAFLHAQSVWLVVGVTLALLVVTWHHGPARLRRAVRILFAIELAQGLVGYTQYWLGIPEALVALHIVGATLFWTAVMAVWNLVDPVRATPEAGAEPRRIPTPSTHST